MSTWVKIPKEHQPVFLDALPPRPDLSTRRIFGSVAKKGAATKKGAARKKTASRQGKPAAKKRRPTKR